MSTALVPQHPRAVQARAALHPEIVAEVAAAVARDRVVVLAMAQNPFCRKARAFLTTKGIPFTCLSYGSYLSQWRKRLAIKLWAGFPTFPMVFVDGVLIGGYTDLVELDKSGELATMLAAKR